MASCSSLVLLHGAYRYCGHTSTNPSTKRPPQATRLSPPTCLPPSQHTSPPSSILSWPSSLLVARPTFGGLATWRHNGVWRVGKLPLHVQVQVKYTQNGRRQNCVKGTISPHLASIDKLELQGQSYWRFKCFSSQSLPYKTHTHTDREWIGQNLLTGKYARWLIS